MKTAFRINNSSAASGGSRKLDCRLHALAAAAAEADFFQLPASQLTQAPRQVAGDLRHMALQHRRTTPIHFVLQRLNDVGMVVAGIVNAVAGQKVQYATTVFREQLATETALILNVHAQQVE